MSIQAFADYSMTGFASTLGCDFQDSSDEGSRSELIEIASHELAATPEDELKLTNLPSILTAATASDSPQSADTSRDSLSEAASSNQTRTSISTTMTGYTNDDEPMNDEEDENNSGEWFIDYVHEPMATDGTVNPASLDNSFNYGATSVHTIADDAILTGPSSPFSEQERTCPDLGHLPDGTFNGAVREEASLEFSYECNYTSHSLDADYMGLQGLLTQSIDGLATVSDMSLLSATMPNHGTAPTAMAPSTPGFDLSGLPFDPSAFQTFVNMISPPYPGSAMPPFVIPRSMSQACFWSHQTTGRKKAIRMLVGPIPTKSRVETQIPIKLSLSSLPAGIKRLHLPTHTISKPKLLARPCPEPSPDMLELTVALVVTSAMQNSEIRSAATQRARRAAEKNLAEEEGQDESLPRAQDGGEVRICQGCIVRERKRAARKKVKKPEDEQAWSKDEARRVVVFNTNEIKEWMQPTAMEPQSMPSHDWLVDIPMRIACYCRHHSEKIGFQVIFTLTDFRGRFVTQGMSPSIMITDDHKTHAYPPQLPGALPPSTRGGLSISIPQDPRMHTQPPGYASYQGGHDFPCFNPHLSGSATPPSPGNFQSTSTTSTTSTMPLSGHVSRSASPCSASPTMPSKKKRKASSAIAKIPADLTMTRMDPALTTGSPPSQQVRGHTSFSSSAGRYPAAGNTSRFGTDTFAHLPTPMVCNNGINSSTNNSTSNSTNNATNNSTNNSTTSATNATNTTNATNSPRTAADSFYSPELISPLDGIVMFSDPASAHTSQSPSPSSLGPNRPFPHSGQHPRRSTSSNLFPPGGSLSPNSPAVIHKVIPSEGPKGGGIEVTILGSGFRHGMVVMFGTEQATTTTYWGETSLVCLLPASDCAGLVDLAFKDDPATFGPGPKLFRYIDMDEQQLMQSYCCHGES